MLLLNTMYMVDEDLNKQLMKILRDRSEAFL